MWNFSRHLKQFSSTVKLAFPQNPPTSISVPTTQISLEIRVRFFRANCVGHEELLEARKIFCHQLCMNFIICRVECPSVEGDVMNYLLLDAPSFSTSKGYEHFKAPFMDLSTSNKSASESSCPVTFVSRVYELRYHRR